MSSQVVNIATRTQTNDQKNVVENKNAQKNFIISIKTIKNYNQ